MKKINIFLLVSALIVSSVPLVLAENLPGSQTQETTNSIGMAFVTRGEAVHKVVETFSLRAKNAGFVTDCLQHLDECFFVFTAMTRYDQVSLNPLKLYPDVSGAYTYADDINLATMLGLVHGNIDIQTSPFYPRAYMSRIHALKVVLGAADLLGWREKFEVVRDLGNEDALRAQKTLFKDVDALRDDSWWYPRYVNFALDSGIIDAGEYYRPDEPISENEYQEMLNRALIKSQLIHAQEGPQAQPSGNSSQQTVN